MTRPQPSSRTVPLIKILLPLYIGLAIAFVILIMRGNLQLLEPVGVVADFQSKILWGALIFACVIGTAIIASFFFVIFHYQEDKHRKYEPTWTAGNKLQAFTWGILTVIILVISFGVWVTTHAIDPYKPLASSKPAVTIQAVALRWKWLFIYPDSGLATVNFIEIPEGTPVNFQLTADAPMSSFWVPRLSGQIYAMPGMVTQLHIQADKTGTFPGASPEINGDGYSGMNFTVKSVSASEYQAWHSSAATHATQSLDYAAYTKLAQPSSYDPDATYKTPDPSLFHEIVMQYMAPGVNQAELQVGGTSL